MELYNGLITEILGRVNSHTPKTWGYEPARAWADNGQNELVLTRDAAYELGGGNLPASNCTAVTTDAALVPEDRIVLVGPRPRRDKGRHALREDSAAARELHKRRRPEAFRTIRDMEFVKYHVFPTGYMMRVSPRAGGSRCA